MRANNNQAAASPVEGRSSTQHNEYYRNRFICHKAVLCNKIVNELASAASRIQSAIEYPILNFLMPEPTGSYQRTKLTKCNKSNLITFGSNKYLGFFNTVHDDSNDAVKDKGGLFKEYLMELKEKYSGNEDVLDLIAYLLQWLEFDDLGVNTTCLYQFVGEHLLNENDRVYAYFLHDGLGTAVELHSFIGHSFYGNTFVHRTAMPVIVKGTGVNAKVYYQHD